MNRPSQRRWLPLAFLGAGLLAVICGALWWAHSDAAPQPRSRSDELALAPTSLDSRTEAPEAAAVSANDAGVAEEALARRTPEQRAGGASTLAIEVLVRDRRYAMALPGAELIWFSGLESRELMRTALLGGFDLDRFRADGHRTLADESGRAVLECPAGDLLVLIVSRYHFGTIVKRVEAATSEPWVVYCDLAEWARVQVVDEAGHPLAGIRVRIAKPDPTDAEDMYRGRTSLPDGVAVLGPILGPYDESRMRLASIEGALIGTAVKEVDLSAVPKDPIRLVLPACGSLELRLLGADGKRFPGPARIALRLGADDEHVLTLPELAVDAGAGGAFVERVGLGLHIKAEVTLPGVGRSFEAFGEGPARAGERSVLDVKLDSDLCTLVGRLADAAGETLAFQSAHLQAQVDAGRPLPRLEADALLDRNGQFALTFDLRQGSELPPLARTRGALLIRADSESGELGLLTQVEWTEGRNDFGLLRLAPAEVLARGRVVDTNGDPVAKAWVELVLPERSEPDALGWSHSLATGADGEFELRGWTSQPIVALQAHFGKQSGKLDVPPGSTGVVLQFKGARTRF